MALIAQVDYSIAGTGVCIGDTSTPKFVDCKFWYMGHTKKEEGSFRNGQIIGIPKMDGYFSEEQRHYQVAKIFFDILVENKVDHVFIEGYSMGSKGGMVFSIQEQTGQFKQLLYHQKIPFTPVPPTTNKKFFTGKGNADKSMMYDQFMTKTSLDIRPDLSYSKKGIVSPISDIVDQFSLFSFGAQSLTSG